MKYVILKVAESKLGFVRVYPVVFPEYMTHKSVADALVHMMGMVESKEATVLSAGFCHIDRWEQWHCTRGSMSLDINSDRKHDFRDQLVLNMPNAAQGIVMDGSCDD